MFIFISIVIIVLLFLYILHRKIKKTRTFWAKRGVSFNNNESYWQLPYDFIRKSSAELFLAFYNQFPNERYHGTFLFMQPMLVIKDPELVKLISVKDFDHFINRRKIVSPDVDPLWGNTLVALQGERWHDVRGTLSPAFTGSKMRIIFNLLEEAAKQFIQHYKNNHEQEFELEFKDVTSRFANDVIATTAFGLKVDSFQNPNNEFFLMGKDATNFSGFRLARFFMASINASLAKFLNIKMIPAHLNKYFSSIIIDAIKEREEKNISRPDMLHLMREAMKKHNSENEKEPITIQDIISQAFIFFIAGFDTVSSSLGFVFYELALNPNIQQKLVEEIDSVESDSLDYEKLFSLRYLDMVISEALRKWPPGLVIERVVNKPYTISPAQPEEKPLELQEGDVVVFPIIGFHKDPNHFPDPEKFDPERFSEENKHSIHPYAYMPFGFGPRHCIGNRFALMEMKIFVFYFLKHFAVSPVARTRIPMVLKKNTFNLVPEGGMYLGIKARN